MEALIVSLVILLQTLLTTTPVAAQYNPSASIYQKCPADSTNYTSGSVFQSDLGNLLQSLARQTPSNGGFFNDSTNDNTVYGLAQCRGDLSRTECSDCLARSVTEIIARCPWRKQAVLRFDGCLTRYSDRRFFSTLSTDDSQILYNANNASDQKLLNRQLGRLLNGLATNASLDSSRFAKGEINYTTTDVGKLYGLVQCTKDLSEGDCVSCLRQSIGYLPGCCSGKIGAQVLSTSCYLRYESSPFYSALSPPPPPPGGASPINRNKSNSSKTVIFIVVATTVAVWKHWTAGTTQQLIDKALPEQFPSIEFHRCIHIGLLCVQGNPANRPTMSLVLLMLSSSSFSVPAPSPPGYFLSDESSESVALMRDLENPNGISRGRGKRGGGDTMKEAEKREGAIE
ncbi:Cysteine-rich repeat secretory protein 38 [Acorus gramineus]|uniref:Cysteine-rich repeat secretory protein 38 n=1 Tax=Acorus gramineus TaxID=55184 RepID=A0AAV9AJB0_ACOGR|nr:Cysteine-rich repeat secretory protein 38 [Acorus gramineus]